MKTEVRIPELGDGDSAPTEATVSFWYFDPGEKVKEGDDLVEILTDKAAFNIEAPASGTLGETSAGEGDEVKPGDVIGYIESEA